jgi:hypothetical protein
MTIEDPSTERRRFELVGLAIAFVILVTIGAFVVAVLLPTREDPPAATATPSPTASTTATPVGPYLTGPVELRSAPDANVAIVTRLAQTDAIRIVGRSESGDWLAIGLVDRPGVTGWVPTSAVAGVADVPSLPVVEALGGAGTPQPGGPTLTPDLPDLVLEEVFTRNNQLMVRIANQGAGDATGEFRVSVRGGAPISLNVKPGEALRSGQSLEGAVPAEYVQLRTGVWVVVVVEDDRREEDESNNVWEGIVEPDQPNDVEILRAEISTADGHFVVDIRNNSPMPIVGSFIVSVREALPSTTLIARRTEALEMAAGEVVLFDFPDLTDVDLTRVTITLSGNAIDDADLSNNTYPR